MKYKHSNKFYKKQYKEYKKEINGYDSLFGSYKKFKDEYKLRESEGETNIRKNLVYGTKYKIEYNTYVAERDMMKKIGIRTKKKTLLGMTTREFAEKYSHEIKVAYHSYRKQGKDMEDSKALISMYFFGSPE